MINLHRACLIATLLWLSSSPETWAEDIQVNSYTTGEQREPSVALDADGDFVVVWLSSGSDGTDTDMGSIQGQRYASDGSSVGGQFQINSYTTGQQGFSFFSPAAVAADADGDFVVVWTSEGSDGTDTDSGSIQGQRYASDGSAVGSQFQINSDTSGNQVSPSVALDADGDFVVVWASLPPDSIVGQRFASDGSPLGREFQVVDSSYFSLYSPSVAASPAGDFVVVWAQLFGCCATEYIDIVGRLYHSDGSPNGDEFEVYNDFLGDQGSRPSVAMDGDGDFVVAWEVDYYSDVFGRPYESGVVPGASFTVNSYTVGSQLAASVAMDGDGNFVVVWESTSSEGTDTDQWSIQGRRYTSDASSVGGQFQVNLHTTGDQRFPSVSINDAGAFVAVWQSTSSGGTDTDANSIQMQSFLSSVFADGFESGDTSLWTSTVSP